MRDWRQNRLVFFTVCMLISVGLLTGSQTALLGPIRDIAAVPLEWLSGVFSRATRGTLEAAQVLNEDPEALRRRVADLEEALARFQAELVQLREIASDYQRLTELLNYTTTQANQEFLTADVIAVSDANDPLRTIVINRGARDGLTRGMPVVTAQGLVGRIERVAANASRVLLIIDPSSAISARLQTTRAEGSVIGRPAGDMVMEFIPLSAVVQEGDLVITSGLGGRLPPDLVIGQVTGVRQRQFDLFQEAVVRSLNDFERLETVLVITSFEPVDLSVFDDPPEAEN